MKCFFNPPTVKRKVPVHTETVKAFEYPMTWLNMALKITGNFEGSGFNQVSGNFDKQGISCGILQWCLGQGSLQRKILLPFIQLYGADALNAHFPISISNLVYMSNKKGVKFAKKKMLNRKNLKSEWKFSWKAFMTLPEVIDIQKAAADSVASKAMKYCVQHEMKTLKSFCFFFDIVTQNGSLKGIPKPTQHDVTSLSESGINRSQWILLLHDKESTILWRWAKKRAVHNKWRNDVLMRKGTIAFGHGTVHGKYFDFREEFKND